MNNTHKMTSIFSSWPLLCFIKYSYTLNHSYCTLEKNDPPEDWEILYPGTKHSIWKIDPPVSICIIEWMVLYQCSSPDNIEIVHNYNFYSILWFPIIRIGNQNSDTWKLSHLWKEFTKFSPSLLPTAQHWWQSSP